MNKLLTVEEIAEILGVKPSTIYQWTHQGFIPHVKLGNLVRFKESTVNKWLDKKESNGRMARKVDIGELGVY